jgi:two-component system nitrogen regulation sensor histidine kinase NtrY
MGTGALQLKAAATDLAIAGRRRRLISLQNIESELSAQELAAWQTVIRVMAHEVMNSLTPISSLSATAHDLVRDVQQKLPADSPQASALGGRLRRARGRGATQRGPAAFRAESSSPDQKAGGADRDTAGSPGIRAPAPAARGRPRRARDSSSARSSNPKRWKWPADAELLDQALINLVRNAMEALRDEPDAPNRPIGSPRCQRSHVMIAVADNGPGRRSRAARQRSSCRFSPRDGWERAWG